MLIALALLQAVTADPGPKPDAVTIVLHYLRGTLNDPESLRDLRVCDPAGPLKDGSWGTVYSFRAKNAMGGYGGTLGYASILKDDKEAGTLGGKSGITGSQALNDGFVSQAASCPLVDAARVTEAMK